MRVVIKVIFVIAISLFLAAPTQAQLFKKGVKIGYIDIARVFDQYEATDIATAELRKDIEDKRKDVEKRTEDINLLKQKLETQGMVIKKEEKTRIEEEVEDKIRELKAITERLNRELRQREQKFVRDILEEIQEVVKVYGKDNGYDLILDKREVLYGPEGMDVTSEIVKIINKRLEKKK